MSLLNIKIAFEKRLALMTPPLQTAYESVSFNPTPGIAYQKVQLVPRRTENPTLGDEHYRDTGEFQIFLSYPTNKGTAEIISRADMIKEFFKRGTTLTEGSTTVRILRTPQISGSTVAGDRIILPVIISYISDENV